MAGYDITQQIKPNKDFAHIEAFFTTKGKDLYAIYPSFSPNLLIRDFKLKPTTTASILGSPKKITIKNVGKNAVVDLSKFQPGGLPGEMIVVKLSDALE